MAHSDHPDWAEKVAHVRNNFENTLDQLILIYDDVHPWVFAEALQEMADNWNEIGDAWAEQDETEEAFQEIVEKMGPVDEDG